MAKKLTFDTDASDALRRGVEKLTRAVKVTLGPRGRNAVLDKGWGGPTVTKDGVTVAEEIDLKDPDENLGVKILKEAASKTSEVAGDGTTTATVLAEAMFTEGLRALASGYSAPALKRGIDKAVERVIDELAGMSRPVSGRNEIQNVAAIAANNDMEIGRMIADAMDKVGKDGVITVEEGKSLDTSVEVVEGMQFDRGFISPHFVTDPERVECVLENCSVLVHEEKISSLNKIVPLLEKVVEAKRPLLIIAEDIDGEALATLVVNRLRGTLEVVAVKAPGYGDRRKAMMQDIAVLTGAQAFFKDLGVDLEQAKLSDLGRARKVTITSEHTTIVKGSGKPAEVQGRINQIRAELENATSDYDREKLQERLAKLTGGVAQINVGAASESELKEKKARVEDALHATRAAVEEGILPGGGTALLRAAARLDRLALKGEEAHGARIVRDALEVPIVTILANGDLEGSVIARKVAEGEGNFGFNALTETYGDMVEMGVIDPTKVVRTALQNAASVAGVLLTSECLITEIPKEKDSKPAGPGGYEDMDF